MVKYLLGVVSGMVLLVLLFVVVLLLALAAGGKAPGVARNTVLALEISGELREHRPTAIDLDFLRRGPAPTLLGLRNALRRAAEDDRVRALELRCGGLAAGWAKAAELRAAIDHFKKSGKPVVGFMQVAGTMDYLVCSAADELYIEPEGMLDVKGLRAEVAFFKNTFDKLGVDVEMERVGKYKSAAEPYIQSEMSEPFREVTNSILDELLEQMGQTIAPSRKIAPERFREVLDEGPFLPPAAERLGLVDGLAYRDEVEDKLREKLGVEEYNSLPLGAYAQANVEPPAFGVKNQIAVVYGVGTILRGSSDADPFFGSDTLGADTLVEALEEARKDAAIKAVILRIDSPGGDAIASDQMWRALELTRREKPVVVSMSDVAASGGYYMAMGEGVPVLAYPGTYTGSIGVFFGKVNLRGLYDKIGLKKEILTRGKFAAIDTDYRPLTPEERAKLREGVEAVYEAFVRKVAEARGASWDEIHEVAQGRVWLGSQARAVNLVDELGGFDRAIELAREKAGIAEGERVTLRTYPRPKRFLEMLMDPRGFAAAPPLAPAFLREGLALGGIWPALSQGGVLAISPYSLTVR